MHADSNSFILSSLGVAQVDGRYVQVGSGVSGASGGLGDEAAVMMISGLGMGSVPNPEVVGGDDQGQCFNAAGKVVPCTIEEGAASTGIMGALQKPIKLIGLSLPLWAWLLIAAGVVTAGWYFLGRRKSVWARKAPP